MLAFSIRTGGGLLAAFAILIATCAPAHVTPRLNEVRSWAFQLQNVDPWEIRQSPYDAGGDRLRLRPGATAPHFRARSSISCGPSRTASKRLILAYLSIGEAESYRYYWQDSWRKQRPEWLEPENPDWPGNYPVQYWHPEWQAILFGSPNAYLDRILDAGFDGVYLDGVDKFEQWKRRRPTAAADMVDLVAAIAAHARALRKDFLVVAAERRRTPRPSEVPADDRRLRARGPALRREASGGAQLPAQHCGLGQAVAAAGGGGRAGLRRRIHQQSRTLRPRCCARSRNSAISAISPAATSNRFRRPPSDADSRIVRDEGQIVEPVQAFAPERDRRSTPRSPRRPGSPGRDSSARAAAAPRSRQH